MRRKLLPLPELLPTSRCAGSDWTCCIISAGHTHLRCSPPRTRLAEASTFRARFKLGLLFRSRPIMAHKHQPRHSDSLRGVNSVEQASGGWQRRRDAGTQAERLTGLGFASLPTVFVAVVGAGGRPARASPAVSVRKQAVLVVDQLTLRGRGGDGRRDWMMGARSKLSFRHDNRAAALEHDYSLLLLASLRNR